MGIKFDKDPLAVERNNYKTKIVNVSIDYDSGGWEILITISYLKIACLVRLV